MRCERCGCIFCDDLADERPGRKRFCSRKCKANASSSRLHGQRRLCRRKKLRYATQDEALTQILVINNTNAGDPGWRPLQATYECPESGGHWHLTSRPNPTT